MVLASGHGRAPAGRTTLRAVAASARRPPPGADRPTLALPTMGDLVTLHMAALAGVEARSRSSTRSRPATDAGQDGAREAPDPMRIRPTPRRHVQGIRPGSSSSRITGGQRRTARVLACWRPRPLSAMNFVVLPAAWAARAHVAADQHAEGLQPAVCSRRQASPSWWQAPPRTPRPPASTGRGSARTELAVRRSTASSVRRRPLRSPRRSRPATRCARRHLPPPPRPRRRPPRRPRTARRRAPRPLLQGASPRASRSAAMRARAATPPGR